MRGIDLTGESALMTGGTRNIGRAIALTQAEAGADVALWYRADDNAARRARTQVADCTGRRVETYRVDVSDKAAVEAGLDAALAEFGAFPIVVHNATWHGPASGMPDVPTSAWRATLAVHLDAAFYLSRALLIRDGALPRGSSIVFISSGRAHGAAPGMAAYGAAKAGLNQFAAMLAQDVGPRGIRVNVVSPGYVETGSAGVTEADRREIQAGTALRRICRPEDVASAVLFFASDLSSFVTGQALQVNGGG